MPTSTFFNLPEEKRAKLLCAIKDEFSRVSFDEVSINKIVRAAEIPRGSFYQYFADKNDMLEYILTDYKKEMFEKMKECLKVSNGDIFNMFYEILQYTIDFTTGKGGNSFCKNLFSDIKINADFYLKMPNKNCEIDKLKELMPLVNVDVLDLREKDDFENMLKILFIVYGNATTKVFLNLSDSKIIKNNYKNKLELLKRGFIKNKE